MRIAGQTRWFWGEIWGTAGEVFGCNNVLFKKLGGKKGGNPRMKDGELWTTVVSLGHHEKVTADGTEKGDGVRRTFRKGVKGKPGLRKTQLWPTPTPARQRPLPRKGIGAYPGKKKTQQGVDWGGKL